MPRVALTREQRRANRQTDGDEALRVGLDAALSRTRTTQGMLADRLGTTSSALSKLKRAPGNMRLELLRDIAYELAMPDAVILAIVKGKRL